MANAADIIVNLVAKTGRFERGMTKGGKKLTKFQIQVKKAAAALAGLAKKFALIAAVAALAIFVKLTKAAIDANDNLGKMATTLGIATERLKGLQLAAELSGVAQASFNKGLVKLGKAVIDAANGLTTYTRIFDRLNLTTEQLLKLAPDEQLLAIGKALAGIESSTERAAIAYDLFGGRNVQLINLLTQSEGAIEAVIQKAQDLGAAMTGLDVARFEVAQDELTLMKTAFEGIRNNLVIDILPAIGIMSGLIQDAAIDANEVTIETDTWVFNLVRSLGAIAGLINAIKQVIRAVGIVGSAIITFMLKPIAKVEEGWNRIADLVPGINIDAENVGLTGFIKGMEQARAEQLLLINDGLGILETMDETVKRWQDYKDAAEKAALVIQKQREDLRKTSAELAEVIRLKAKADAAEKVALAERLAREKELSTILAAGQAGSVAIAKKIGVLNAGILESRAGAIRAEQTINGLIVKRVALLFDIKAADTDARKVKLTFDLAKLNAELAAARAAGAISEAEINKILAVRAVLLKDLVEAQEEEQGIETAADRAKLLASILEKAQKESLRVAKQIASINIAILKGEGDRNELFRARKILIEELIQAQKDEQAQVSKLTEIGLQTLRNMQDALADFFATTSGGFRGLVSGFTDMLRKMVAQLLARRILLSFLGLFARGSGGLAAFAQKAIAGLAAGGALAAGQAALVGEKEPEVFVPKNVLSFPTLAKFPAAVARDVGERHAEGTLPVDQIRMIAKRGPEILTPKVAGTVVPMALFSKNVLADIEKRQGGGPLAAGQAAIVGEAGPELFIPKSAGQVIPSGKAGSIVVTIEQNNSFSGSGPLEPAVLIPLLEENNRKLKAEFVDELRRGTFG